MSKSTEAAASTVPNETSMEETDSAKAEEPTPREQGTCQCSTPPTEAALSRLDTGRRTVEESKLPHEQTESTPGPLHSPNEQSKQEEDVASSATHRLASPTSARVGVSEWSHQQLVPQTGITNKEKATEEDDEWQTMPAYAPYDIYDDDNKLVAREHVEETDEAVPGYSNMMGGAARGYTRVQVDEDAQSATSMDDNTAYLFKNPISNQLDVEDEEARDVVAQMQTTKKLLTDNQRIAYVGIVKLATAQMCKDIATVERTRGSKKLVDLATEALQLWAQKMMVRLYSHIELEAAEQMMIEQLAEHGLEAGDLSPALMTSNHIKNPMPESGTRESLDSSKSDIKHHADVETTEHPDEPFEDTASASAAPPPYSAHDADDHVPPVQAQSELLKQAEVDIDLRWTVLCDLFLILISDSTYDARSRVLLEKVAATLAIPWLDVCRFEKRVTEALEMEEEARKEDWNEADHLQARKKRARNRRLALMGLATLGGGIVIGLSAGLLAPVIGAGLAAGFTTIGVTGTSGFLAGAGGAAVIGSVGTFTGGTIGVRAANRRTGAVKTFEYRPLHNNKRVNLIVTVAGWMNGKVDDVRLPYSTIDPVMGDIYSILWEPEMLRSMGDTINILATEALTQGLQQVLGSTILIALMAAIQLPIVLSKLSYLIDNPWSVSVARADAAGLILADSLIDRNLGARPITLVGFSLGSRVIFSCLRELAAKGAIGLIQNVYIFGTPVVVRKDEYLRARAIVSGRFVNGYATNDWILGYLFRATGGGIMQVAGLTEVLVPGIENVNVTEIVPGHMSYRQCMPKLLREVGWAVESDEFTEIEDPDPENHEKRQRELINEIEEARKELQAQPEKRRFGLFKRNKKLAQKKDWEMYDERAKQGDPDRGGDPDGPLFDIEAIRKATVELASEGVDVTELETTMPPMKIASSRVSSPMPATAQTPPTHTSIASSSAAPSANQSVETLPTLANGHKPVEQHNDSYFPQHGRNQSDQLYYENEDITMSFEAPVDRPPSLPPKPIATPSPSSSPLKNGAWEVNDRVGGSFDLSAPYVPSDASEPARSLTLDPKAPWSASSSKTVDMPFRSPFLDPTNHKDGHSLPRQSTAPTLSTNHNVWADDEDDLDDGREVSMSFE